MFGWLKKKPSRPDGPDFSAIDSREKAEELFRRGELEMLYLLPLEFGGSDDPHNVVFVPVGIAAAKDGIDQNVIAPLIEDAKVSRYSATPRYQGRSFIPTAIRVVASDPGQFSTTIFIWGDALNGNAAT